MFLKEVEMLNMIPTKREIWDLFPVCALFARRDPRLCTKRRFSSARRRVKEGGRILVLRPRTGLSINAGSLAPSCPSMQHEFKFDVCVTLASSVSVMMQPFLLLSSEEGEVNLHRNPEVISLPKSNKNALLLLIKQL